MGLEGVHVLAHQVQEVEPVRTGGVPQVDDPHPVTVAFLGDAPVIPHHIAFGVRGEEGHPAGHGVFQARVQPVGGLAHASGTDHDGMNVPGVHQGVGGAGLGERLSGVLAHPAHHQIPHHPEQVVGQMTVCLTSNHDTLFFGQVFSFPPQLWLEGNVEVCHLDFSLGGPSGSTVLAMSHGLCLDVQVVHSRQSGNYCQGPEHGSPSNDQLNNGFHEISLPFLDELNPSGLLQTKGPDCQGSAEDHIGLYGQQRRIGDIRKLNVVGPGEDVFSSGEEHIPGPREVLGPHLVDVDFADGNLIPNLVPQSAVRRKQVQGGQELP